MIPVKVVGYSGLDAGVESNQLKAGMLVVVGGNERLGDQQAVVLQKTSDRGPNAEVGMRKPED